MRNTDKKKQIEIKYIKKSIKLALADFELFCKYAGVQSIQLKVCIERSNGLTFGQISKKLNVSRPTVQSMCNRCFK